MIDLTIRMETIVRLGLFPQIFSCLRVKKTRSLECNCVSNYH